MKRILFAALLFSGFAASAQQGSPGTIATDTTGEKFRKMYDLIQQRSLLPQATYSHTTSRGKVYMLPYDNMPCLVPDMNQVERMPQYNLPEGRMPNLIPRQRLIPDEQKENKKPR